MGMWNRHLLIPRKYMKIKFLIYFELSGGYLDVKFNIAIIGLIQ